MNPIPLPYRILAGAAVIVAAAALGAMGGATVATWRADANHGEAIQAKDATILRLEGEKAELKLAIAEQNEAVAVAEAQTLAANEAKAKAEQHAADLAAFSKSRLDKLAQSFASATSCDDVLRSYWELRK